MKSLFIAAYLLSFAAGASAFSQEPPPKPPEPPPHTPPPAKVVAVRGAGCIEPGIEARCFIVKDIKSSKLFNLIIRGIQPSPGEGVEFIGVLHSGPTSCMQGTPIDVTEWSRKDELNCKPLAPRKR